MRTVAILGAGPSGLVSAKTALECGLVPTVFEQAETFGGVWRPETGFTWGSMCTNLSRFSCMFSDFPWQQTVALFPSQQEMYDYLKRYIEYFNLSSYLHFKRTVTQVTKTKNFWQVCWTDGQNETIETFDFIIIATGIFSKPYIPAIKGMEKFQGKILHSKNYKLPQSCLNKRVAIIGGSYSGTEIAVDVSHVAAKTTHIFTQPFWVIPRCIPQDSKVSKQVFPMDLIFFQREKSAALHNLATAEKNKVLNTYFASLCTEQSRTCPEMTINANSEEPPRIVISDNYLERVRNNKIFIQKKTIQHIDNDQLVFADGSSEPADVIIFATGFKADLPFFDSNILAQLEFDFNDQFQPLLLHKCTFHPQFPDLAFVGLYRGPYFAVMELQARWANMVFAGMLSRPTLEAMQNGIANELAIRQQIPRPQFPHADYVELADSIAQEIGAMPDFKALKNEDANLYKVLYTWPVIPAHYRFVGEGSSPELAYEQSLLAKRVLES